MALAHFKREHSGHPVQVVNKEELPKDYKMVNYENR